MAYRNSADAVLHGFCVGREARHPEDGKCLRSASRRLLSADAAENTYWP